MKTALLQVKEELGVDAVIMSNKKVAGGVEIVAAVDGDTAPAPAKRYNSQPRHGYNQVSPSVAPTKSRELADDRVSLQSSADSGRSMTQRFANMLKQYSSADEQEHRAENEDSLSALLKRQSENRAPQRNQTQRSQSSQSVNALTLRSVSCCKKIPMHAVSLGWIRLVMIEKCPKSRWSPSVN